MKILSATWARMKRRVNELQERVNSLEDDIVGLEQANHFLGEANAELATTTNKLPKTADGVLVVPGMTLYLLKPSGCGLFTLYIPVNDDYAWYSTPEAAKESKS